jgi:hypothetical protein
MEITRLVAEEHREIRVAVNNGLFHLGDAEDILELGLCANEVFSTRSTQTLEDITSLILSTDFDEPSR